MRRSGFMAALAALAAITLVVNDVDAKRLGGGRSFGAQRQSIAPAPHASTPPSTASSAAPGAASNPVMPANPSAVAPRAAAPVAGAAAAAPARSGMSRWLGPIAGIAAGLGLAALLSHFGLSEAFASFLLIGLLVLAAVVVLRLIFARRTPTPMQYAGAGTPRSPWSDDPSSRRDERVEPVFGRNPSSGVSPRVPPGFDREGFLRQARMQFKSLQAAWDSGDRSVLADVTTPQMFDEINRDLATRGAHQSSDVARLDAELLEVVTEGTEHWASVRFTGLIREDGADAPKLFDETWNLVKPVDGSSGWLLAGIQQNEAAAVH